MLFVRLQSAAMPSTPSDVVFLVGFVVYTGIRHVYQRRVQDESSAETRVGGAEKALLPLVMLGCLVLPALYLFTPLFGFADYALPPAAFWAGTAVMLLALGLFWRSHADLGRNWSVTLELREDHRLIDDGVYRRIRHPMYTAIFLFGLAQLLLLANGIAGPSALVTFTPLYLARVGREEQMMRDQFGEAYAEYEKRTGRLLPRLFRS